MSFQITTAFVQQYASNVSMLVQQKGSRLRDAVRVESVNGEFEYFDQIGAGSARCPRPKMEENRSPRPPNPPTSRPKFHP